MKPILVINLKENLSQKQLDEIGRQIKSNVGDGCYVFVMCNSNNNSVKILHGRSTRIKGHQLNKILNKCSI